MYQKVPQISFAGLSLLERKVLAGQVFLLPDIYSLSFEWMFLLIS